jgi:SNF2 family DNA or RNA helicase
VHLYADTDRTDLLARVRTDVVVVSYAVAAAAEAFRTAAGTLIADEAQAIKNSAAKRSLALFDLEADFAWRSPVRRGKSPERAVVDHGLLNPGLLGTAARFRERFATPIERDRNRETQQLLRRVIAPFVLRRTKAQVLHELPARTEIVLPIAPSLEEASHYEALRRSALAQVDAIRAVVAWCNRASTSLRN